MSWIREGFMDPTPFIIIHRNNEKNPSKCSATAENWNWAMEQAHGEIYYFTHWAIITELSDLDSIYAMISPNGFNINAIVLTERFLIL